MLRNSIPLWEWYLLLRLFSCWCSATGGRSSSCTSSWCGAASRCSATGCRSSRSTSSWCRTSRCCCCCGHHSWIYWYYHWAGCDNSNRKMAQISKFSNDYSIKYNKMFNIRYPCIFGIYSWGLGWLWQSS